MTAPSPSAAFEIAYAANFQWDTQTAITMTAIAYAESSQGTQLFGDPISSFPSYMVGLSWGGFFSIGPWQIFLPFWAKDLYDLYGISDLKTLVSRLLIPGSAVTAAQLILERQGLAAWSSYNAGAYQAQAVDAEANINAVKAMLTPDREHVRELLADLDESLESQKILVGKQKGTLDDLSNLYQ